MVITTQNFFVYNNGNLERSDLLPPFPPPLMADALGDVRRSDQPGNVDYDTCAFTEGIYSKDVCTYSYVQSMTMKIFTKNLNNYWSYTFV